MANPLVEFNDSQVGVYLGSVLHTLGAIAFLGGLVAYVSWHRHLAAQRQHHRALLETGALLSYGAIVVNLLGGFMRTFQTGHPHLTQFAESPWVRAIAIKHLFLFAAMGAAIYLFERVAPRLLRAHKAGTLQDASPPGHRVGVVLVVLGIVVAAILGAVTQVVPVVSADAEEEDHGHAMEGDVLFHNATGQLTSSPLAPATATGTFEVPNATVRFEATLTWTPAQTQLRLELTAPNGEKVAVPNTTGGTIAVERFAPPEGSWTYAIASDLAVNVAWTLSLRMETAPESGAMLGGSVTIPAGDFFEINTEMEEGASFGWAWQASATVRFDVHSHFEGAVQEHASAEETSGEGHFTNDRAGGYSLMWENAGTQPVTLDYLVWGDFVVESLVP